MKKNEYKKEIGSIVSNSQWKEEMKKNLSLPIVKKRQSFPLRYVSLVLVTCCLILGFIYINQNAHITPNKPVVDEPTNDPKPDEPTEEQPYYQNPISQGDFGYSAIMVKNSDELIHNNPYNLSASSKTMPVYKNLYLRNYEELTTESYSIEKAIEVLKIYAKKLGVSDYTIDKTNIPTLKSKNITCLYEETSVLIEFSDDYVKKLNISLGVSSKKQANKVTLELYKKYANVIDIKNPLINCYYDYFYSGEKNWSFQVSEKTSNQNINLINQSLKKVNFYGDDNKLFRGMRIFFEDTEIDKEVPIISLNEAKKRFENNQYLTTGNEMKGKEVGYIEMVYYTSQYSEYYLPYYLFYVLEENPQDEESKQTQLKTYVLCYVSALSEEAMKEYKVPLTMQFN